LGDDEIDLQDLEDGYDYIPKNSYFLPFVNQNQISTTIGNEIYIVEKGAVEKEETIKNIKENP